MSAPPRQTFTVNNGVFTYIGRDQVNHNYPSFSHPTTSHANTNDLNQYPQNSSPTGYPSGRPQQSEQTAGTTFSQNLAEGPRVPTAQAPVSSSMSDFENQDPQVTVSSEVSPMYLPTGPGPLLYSLPAPRRESQLQFQSCVQGSTQGGTLYAPSPSSTGVPPNNSPITPTHAYSPMPPPGLGVGVHMYQPTQTSSTNIYPHSARIPMSNAASTPVSPPTVSSQPFSQYSAYDPHHASETAHLRQYSHHAPAGAGPDPYVQRIYRQNQLRQQSHQMLWQDPQAPGYHIPNVPYPPPMENFSDANYFRAEPEVEDFGSAAPRPACPTSGHGQSEPAYRRATVASSGGGNYAVSYHEQNIGYPSR